jgi:hypothetical protein
MPQPFLGQNLITFKVRPPTPRRDPRDRLFVEFNLTRRDDSTSIQVLQGSDRDSVRVLIVLNEAGYVAPPEPPRRGRQLTLADIERMDPAAGAIMRDVIFASILGGLHAPIILNEGVETHTYNPLPPPRLGNLARMAVDRLRPVEHRTVIDNTQPFPVAGALTLEWERFARVAAPPGRRRAARRRTGGGS